MGELETGTQTIKQNIGRSKTYIAFRKVKGWNKLNGRGYHVSVYHVNKNSEAGIMMPHDDGKDIKKEGFGTC